MGVLTAIFLRAEAGEGDKLPSKSLDPIGQTPPAAAQSVLNVVPAVQSWTPAQGMFAASRANICVSGADAAQLNNVAEMFQKDLTAMGCGLHHLSASNSFGGFVLTLDRTANEIPPEGYRIEIGDRVVICGSTATGVFYGTRTVLQLLAQHPKDQQLPKGVIMDWPVYKHRMLMLDVARKPYPMPVLKDYLRMLAWYKMNELHLHLSDEAFGGKYTGFRVECDTFPGLTSRDLFYTKKELREFQDLAHEMGITITPEIDMPGHARCFTDYWPDLALRGYPDYLDVTNPQTAERLKRLLDEMIPIFDAPDFHIGTDEYRVAGTKEEKEKLDEAFRQFINTMNAHVRSLGKTTRIWSGFEHMPGPTEIATNITIDMWETYDARSSISRGHNVINSSDGLTYIVPGAHYYGVNNSGIYNEWEPWMISDDMSKDPAKNDPHLLGGKLHVWGDQGPTGYTMTEIAKLVLPSLQVFAEKLWGIKGSQNYREFQSRAAMTQAVPGVTVFDRLPAKTPDGMLLNLPDEQTLANTNSFILLPYAGQSRCDLEYPWTLKVEVCKTSETGGRGVILSSALAEICTDFTRVEEQKTKNGAGMEIRTQVKKHGIGVVRAAGSPGIDAASSHLSKDVSRVYSDPLTLNHWTSVVIVGERGRTVVYLDGVKTGESNNQTICPLAELGSQTGNSFVGKIRNLKVYNHALSTGLVSKTGE